MVWYFHTHLVIAGFQGQVQSAGSPIRRLYFISCVFRSQPSFCSTWSLSCFQFVLLDVQKRLVDWFVCRSLSLLLNHSLVSLSASLF